MLCVCFDVVSLYAVTMTYLFFHFGSNIFIPLTSYRLKIVFLSLFDGWIVTQAIILVYYLSMHVVNCYLITYYDSFITLLMFMDAIIPIV